MHPCLCLSLSTYRDRPGVRRRLRERDYAVSENGVSVRICRWDKLAVAISFGINFAGWLAPPS